MLFHLAVGAGTIRIAARGSRSDRITLGSVPDGLLTPRLGVGNNLLVLLLSHYRFFFLLEQELPVFFIPLREIFIFFLPYIEPFF